MKILYFLTIGFFLSLFLSCKSQEQEVWNVYYFGGQSNMDGYGYNSELPDNLDGIIASSFGEKTCGCSVLGSICKTSAIFY